MIRVYHTETELQDGVAQEEANGFVVREYGMSVVPKEKTEHIGVPGQLKTVYDERIIWTVLFDAIR